MILTMMPDLPPQPATAANAAFREMFIRRKGRENTLVCARSRDVSYPPNDHTLSVKAAWGGRERYLLPEREVAVDDDHWMVINERRTYGSALQASRPVTSFALFFRHGLGQEVAAARGQTLARQLDAPDAAPRAMEMSEHLRPHGGPVSHRLRRMHDEAMAGERSEDWLETQSLLLVDDILGSATRLANGPRNARTELERRLRLAADYIETCHAEPIGLADMARVACMSRYHFVRHFRALYGITPYAYLLRKRARVARRVFDAGIHDREGVALAVGFANRFALARALTRHG